MRSVSPTKELKKKLKVSLNFNGDMGQEDVIVDFENLPEELKRSEMFEYPDQLFPGYEQLTFD